MKYGYARVSTDGQSVDAQVRHLRAEGCEKVFREVASGAKTDRRQLRRAIEQPAVGEAVREIAHSYNVHGSTISRLDHDS
jgi:predicted site-specific integrase-resolvase